MSRILAAVLFLLGLIPNIVIQVHPDEAIKNLRGWLNALQIPIPIYLTPQNSKKLIRKLCGVFMIVGFVWFLWPNIIAESHLIHTWINPNDDTKREKWLPARKKYPKVEGISQDDVHISENWRASPDSTQGTIDITITNDTGVIWEKPMFIFEVENWQRWQRCLTQRRKLRGLLGQGRLGI